MSYRSRVFRQRNAHTHDESEKQEPFFSKQNDRDKNESGNTNEKRMKVNTLGDAFEKEADQAAESVIGHGSQKPSVQKKGYPEVQRLSSSKDDEKLGTNEARMEKDKEIQEKPMEMGETKKEEDEKVSAQAKSQSPVSYASPGTSTKIQENTGKGKKLPGKTLKEMNASFGVDFSGVRIHTDSPAEEMNKDLNAQAFTHGQDIYFNQGKFDPNTREGRKLIAHELTHVLQQNAGKWIRRKGDGRAVTQKKYDITIEKGDKDWSDSDLKLLQNALSRLSKAEAHVLRKYRFVRWSTKENRQKIDKDYIDPGAQECGLHEINLQKGLFRISLYDSCFKDPEAVSDTTAGIDTGQFHLLHEMGHAFENAELRDRYEAYQSGHLKYNQEVDKYNKASAGDQAKMKSKVESLGKAESKLDTEMTQSQGRSIKEFESLVSGKEALTEYSKENVQEALAEAFAIYKADPEGLKKTNRKLYDWFQKGGWQKPGTVKK